jgi:membrane glycosyltransferase
MSHDFVEAALMRRAGYAVHMLPDLEGSYEECPPTLDALIQRDRRWCQGNLQHLRVVGARGLHWASRLHLLNGALAYLTAPMWFALLSMSVLLPLAPYLSGGLAEEIDAAPAAARHDAMVVAWLFVASMSFLIAPKLLAYGLAMADRRERRAFGGWLRAAAGLGLEFVMSLLIAPVMMLSQTRLVVDLLLGRDSGWSAQQRAEDRFDLWDACACHGWHTAVGLVMGTLAWRASPTVFLWLSPVLTGLLLSIPISLLVARRDLGLSARACGLLTTPEESRPPAVLARANQLAGHGAPPRAAWPQRRPAPALDFGVLASSVPPAE